MNAQDLKNSILQLAIQGKLVEQREEEGTAKELIKQIEAEKKHLIKEGKIKKQKELPEIKVDEIPFDIPGSWEWQRLSDVCLLTDGVKVKNVSLPYLEARYLRGKIDPKIKKSGKFINRGEYVILVDGENSGEVFITEEEGIIGSTFKVLSINSAMHDKYILNLLRFYQRLFRERKRGAAIPHLDKTLFKTLVIGVPPLEEQKRIVAKIEELLPYLDKYDVAYSEVEELNKKFPEDMQKSILQYAIQGKLVEQREEDGKAEDLYKQIQEEKKKLIKEGKIRNTKALPEITEDEIPFDIPENWKWVRLGELCEKIGSGSTPTGGKSVYKESGIKFLRSQNIYNDGLRIEGVAFISEEQNKQGSIVKPRDILLNITGGSIGRCALVPDDFDIANINQHVMIIRNIAIGSRFFLHNILISPYVQSMIMSVQVGVSREGLSAEKLKNFLIPLPPLAEQKRIVEKIEELLPYTKQLVKKPD